MQRVPQPFVPSLFAKKRISLPRLFLQHTFCIVTLLHKGKWCDKITLYKNKRLYGIYKT